MSSWVECKHLYEGEVGSAKLFRCEISVMQSRISALRGGLEYCPAGAYWNLTIDGHVVMSNTRMERISNWDIVRNAHGEVLLGGLGIGMVACALISKPEVRGVTILEVEPDVISLIRPMLPSNGHRLLQADVFTWTPDRKFNVIWFDIWSDICTDNLTEIALLHQRYKWALDRSDSDCWMSSWMVDHLRSEHRRERKRHEHT